MTSEHPADHPHHNSFWFAADHVYCRMPVTHGKGYEDYTYNLYLNETFQGRAPGRIVETACAGTAGRRRFRIAQMLDWRGPAEWAAPDGRLAARETRTLQIRRRGDAKVIEVESRLAAVDWDFTLGPTRHAYFNVRMADSMIVALGGAVRDDRGRIGGDAVSGRMRAGSISPVRSAAGRWRASRCFPIHATIRTSDGSSPTGAWSR